VIDRMGREAQDKRLQQDESKNERKSRFDEGFKGKEQKFNIVEKPVFFRQLNFSNRCSS